jgi:hypothetical protein
VTSNGERAPFWPGLGTAREIAAAAGVRSVGTQHVLLAILRRGGDATAALHAGGVDEDAVHGALRGIAGTGCRSGAVHVDWVSVSPRVLALVRVAACAGGTGTVTDLDVLDALLRAEEPSLAHLVLSALGAHRRVRLALPARRTRVDPAGGGLVDA